MSDLDELASASGGSGSGSAGGHGRTRPPAAVVEVAPPEDEGPAPRVAPWVWIAMAAGICLVLGVAFWLTRRDVEPAGQAAGAGQVSRPAAQGAAAPSVGTRAPRAPDRNAAPSRQLGAAASTQVSGSGKPRQTASTARTRVPLQDIADPYEALDIYHLQRAEGDTLEIRARNKSRRGLYVKSVELYGESDDRNPLDNIGFWLPPGDLAVATRQVPELSRRLGPNEAVKAVIVEAEFRDATPAELASPPAAGAAGDGLGE